MKQKLKALLENPFIRGAGEIAQQIFVVLLVTYLLLLLAETIWEESASSLLNLNYLLIAVIVVGIPAVLTAGGRPDAKVKKSLDWKDVVMIGCAGNFGMVIVWFKTRDIGWPSYLMAIVSCALIIILSLLILRGGDEGEDTEDK